MIFKMPLCHQGLCREHTGVIHPVPVLSIALLNSAILNTSPPLLNGSLTEDAQKDAGGQIYTYLVCSNPHFPFT